MEVGARVVYLLYTPSTFVDEGKPFYCVPEDFSDEASAEKSETRRRKEQQ